MILLNGQVNYIDMKQTAVEWLVEQIEKDSDVIFYERNLHPFEEYVKQAKAMEKEQAQKMYEYAAWAMFYNGHGQTFEEYWNKNFKSE